MRKYHGKEMYLKAKKALARKNRLLELIGDGASPKTLHENGYNIGSPKDNVPLRTN